MFKNMKKMRKNFDFLLLLLAMYFIVLVVKKLVWTTNWCSQCPTLFQNVFTFISETIHFIKKSIWFFQIIPLQCNNKMKKSIKHHWPTAKMLQKVWWLVLTNFGPLIPNRHSFLSYTSGFREKWPQISENAPVLPCQSFMNASQGYAGHSYRKPVSHLGMEWSRPPSNINANPDNLPCTFICTYIHLLGTCFVEYMWSLSTMRQKLYSYLLSTHLGALPSLYQGPRIFLKHGIHRQTSILKHRWVIYGLYLRMS